MLTGVKIVASLGSLDLDRGSKMWFRVALICCFVFLCSVSIARAAEKISYGSRAGMEVTVVSMLGLNSNHATIRVRHTREDATRFCSKYARKIFNKCIGEEMDKRLNEEINADCRQGIFTDFWGGTFRFKGKNHHVEYATDPKYVLIDLDTDATLDGSEASGYHTELGIFKALCPDLAPTEDR